MLTIGVVMLLKLAEADWCTQLPCPDASSAGAAAAGAVSPGNHHARDGAEDD